MPGFLQGFRVAQDLPGVPDDGSAVVVGTKSVEPLASSTGLPLTAWPVLVTTPDDSAVGCHCSYLAQVPSL